MVVKFFLHLSKEEQRKRFLARIEEPEKNWKFSRHDYDERAYWEQYQQAYDDLLSSTNTKWAPWYVIPADNKWFTRLCVSEVLVRTLRAMKLKYPEASPELVADLRRIRRKLEKEG